MTEWWKCELEGMSRVLPILRGKNTYFHPGLYSSHRFTKGRYSVAVSMGLVVGLEPRGYVPNKFQKITVPTELPPPNLRVSCRREPMAFARWRLKRSKKLHLTSEF